MFVLVSNSILFGSVNFIFYINDVILYLNEMKVSGFFFDQFINQGVLFFEKKWYLWVVYLSCLMFQGQCKFKRVIKVFNESVWCNIGVVLFFDENVIFEEVFQVYVIGYILVEEVWLIEVYVNVFNLFKSCYFDWFFVGNMGGSMVYVDC